MNQRQKRCACCGQLFPVTDFGLNATTADGRSYYTRAHAAEIQRQYRLNNPDRVRASRKKYVDKLRARNRSGAPE